MKLYSRIAAMLICVVLIACACAEVFAEDRNGSTVQISGSKYVAKGKKITLTANQEVTWKSSNKKIAKVSRNGVVKGIKKGTVTITAVSVANPKDRKEWKIKVTPRPVDKIKIKAPTKKLDLEEKTTVQLSAQAVPSDAAQSFTWSSSDEAVATVNKKGKVTAKGAGKVTITAAATDGSGAKADITLTVKTSGKKEEVPEIRDGDTRIEDETFYGNQSITDIDLPESIEYIGHRAFANSSIRFIYLPAGISLIEEDAFDQCPNLECLVPPGCYADNWCAAHGVRRHDPDYIASIEPGKKAEIVKNGGTHKVKPAVTPSITKAKLKWESKDENIFTVDESGTVYGVYPGKASLIVRSPDGSLSAKITVTVQANYRAVLFSESTFAGGVIQRNRGDVKLMKGMLNTVTGPDGGTYEIYTFDDLTAKQVYAKIKELLITPSRDGDVSMFFFASHGDYRSSSEKYAGRLWCKMKETWLELPKLAKELGKVRGKVIVLLESCGPGAALHDFNGGTGEEKAEGGEYEDAPEDAREIISAFASADPGLTVYQPKEEDGKTGKGRNSKEMRARNSFKTEKFIVMTAAAYHQVSYSVGTDTYNLFPYWLVKGVGTSKDMPADKECGNGNGKLTLDELYKYVYKHTSYKQTPQVYPQNSSYVLFLRKK